MQRHFGCTLCGKCCYGWLPLTLGDALRHADLFPLFVVWTTARQGSRSFAHVSGLGITIRDDRRRNVAVQIAPTACMPASFSCPALTDDGRCAIQHAKPLRCRAMPLAASRAEADQDDLLIPRAGWRCDVSAAAPLVYRDRAIIDRADYDREHAALVADAAVLRRYAEGMVAGVPSLRRELAKAAARPAHGCVIVDFLTLIPRLPTVDIRAFARRQAPVMAHFAERTSGRPDLADDHRRFRACGEELARIAAGER